MGQILLAGWLGTTVRVRLDPLFILLLLETVVNQKKTRSYWLSLVNPFSLIFET
jgi:hypothetical protein